MEAIWDSAVYARKSKSGHLAGLYYLVLWKRYPKEENTWELASAVQHLRKLISSFHKDHPDKSTATFLAINTVPPIVKLTIKLSIKRKRRRPVKKRATKCNKWGNKEGIRVSLFFWSQKLTGSRRSVFLMERQGACIWWFDYLQFDCAKN